MNRGNERDTSASVCPGQPPRSDVTCATAQSALPRPAAAGRREGEGGGTRDRRRESRPLSLAHHRSELSPEFKKPAGLKVHVISRQGTAFIISLSRLVNVRVPAHVMRETLSLAAGIDKGQAGAVASITSLG
jgi:hypothetical protein